MTAAPLPFRLTDDGVQFTDAHWHRQICSILGRAPILAEAVLFWACWSEAADKQSIVIWPGDGIDDLTACKGRLLPPDMVDRIAPYDPAAPPDASAILVLTAPADGDMVRQISSLPCPSCGLVPASLKTGLEALAAPDRAPVFPGQILADFHDLDPAGIWLFRQPPLSVPVAAAAIPDEAAAVPLRPVMAKDAASDQLRITRLAPGKDILARHGPVLDVTGQFQRQGSLSQHQLPDLMLVDADQAIMTGYGGLVVQDGRDLVVDCLGPNAVELFHGNPAFAGWNRLQRNGEFWMTGGLEPVRKVPGLMIDLCYHSTLPYTHFLLEVFPRLLLMKRHLGVDFSEANVVIEAGSHAWQLDMLRDVGVAEDKIILRPHKEVWQGERVLMPGFPAFANMWSLPVLSALFEDVAQAIAGQAEDVTAAEKLVLVRKDEKSWIRRLLNEDAIAARLTAQGFTVLDPSDLSLAEKVQAFSRAKMVVSSYGGGLINAMVFAPRQCRFVILQSPAFARFPFDFMAAHRDYHHVYVQGSVMPRHAEPNNGHFLVPEDLVDAVVTEVMKGL